MNIQFNIILKLKKCTWIHIQFNSTYAISTLSNNIAWDGMKGIYNLNCTDKKEQNFKIIPIMIDWIFVFVNCFSPRRKIVYIGTSFTC